MNKIKIILDYLVGFIFSCLLALLTILFISKNFIYNKNYIKNLLEKNNYYETVANEIEDSMKSYMISSGLQEEILTNIYTKDDVKKDINLFIDNTYKGEITKLNKDNIKNNLNKNIDDYLDKHNVKISDKKLLKEFVDDMINIYKDEITLFGTANSVINIFSRIGNYLNIFIIVSIAIILILIILSKIFKFQYIKSSFLASGIILLFIRFVIYDKIDVKNILIITEYFSKVLNIVLEKIGSLLLIWGIIFIIFGLIVSIINSYSLNALEKKKMN